MSITKILLTFSLLCSLMMPVMAQRQNTRRSRGKAGDQAQSSNRGPIINLLKASSPTVIIPCPTWIAGAWSEPAVNLNLATDASDPEGERLIYKYVVTGGRITGTGSNVTWDLTGVAPNTHEATVTVSDQRGAATSRSIKVAAQVPNCCLGPCAMLSVPCPDDVEDGTPLTFTASLSGGEPTVEPIPTWSVSAGTIVKGQGSYTIEVDTNGLGGQHIEATFQVSGYPPECSTRASCKIRVRKKDAQ